MVSSGVEKHNQAITGAEKIALPRKPYTSYNPYFLIPFIFWVIGGGLAQLLFDRQLLFASINTRHTSVLDIIMVNVTVMGEGIFSATILLLLLARSTLRNLWYIVAAVLTNVLPSIMTQVIKSSVNAPRPLNYFKEAEWIHTLPEWPRLMERSFPSGHTCAAFCLFTFLAVLLPPKFRGWGLFFFALAILVGISRLYLAAHFFLDIYVGSIIGTIFTLIIIAIMNSKQGIFFKDNLLNEMES